ncbi:MAG: M4 family metallopeptidase [Haliscomenobacter sp.]|nr:M4 family metallopeptidase [Haliscomenobacter sp.]
MFSYLEHHKEALGMAIPEESFSVRESWQDALGWSHVRLLQTHLGVEVYGGELLAHLKDGAVEFLNGRYHRAPSTRQVAPTIGAAEALALAWKSLGYPEGPPALAPALAPLIGEQTALQKLVVRMPRSGASPERLAWYMELAPGISRRYAVFVDAHTGAILESFSQLCHLGAGHVHTPQPLSPPTPQPLNPLTPDAFALPLIDGPDSATAKDLQGVNRRIYNYRSGNLYFLMDVTRSMFNAARSQLPGGPQGAIWTIDADNKVDSENLQLFQVTSANNTWNNPAAISAHYNAGRAYEYYLKTFKRNSINGKGGNIISIINIADDDGTGLDNAYWNGNAIFYGNGKQAFSSLARGLDVAGHEMTHGVIQNAANMEYYGESGALNESFADIFGVMIDREDFKIGEDVVKLSVFPSGAMRDMANPNNGGKSLSDRGWQPAHTGEQYTGDADNGGVHINSGIPNRAFYLFATAVGKETAEQVYFYALTNLLTRTSRFIDCRLAVAQAAKVLFNASVAAAAEQAFTTVGISGSTPPTSQPGAYAANPGEQFILAVDTDSTGMFIYDLNGQSVGTLATNEKIISKPSITDDGSVILYVNANRQIRYQILNWTTGQTQSGTLSSQSIWRNAAIAKDGDKIAAITAEYEPQIYVASLVNSAKAKFFPLYSPTFTEGVQSGQVRYADALEWDLAGEYVVYDALNQVSLLGGAPYLYWDIGILHAWDNPADQPAKGDIEKLITGLSERESIGFPAFSKNSPNIIAFDYVIDVDGNNVFTEADEYYLIGLDIQKGTLRTVLQNNTFGIPNYGVDDDYLLFDNEASNGVTQVAFVQLKTDKLSPAANPGVFLSQRMWASWFATGQRVLTDAKERPGPEQALSVFPNPFDGTLQIALELPQAGDLQASLWDALGRRVWTASFPGQPSGAFGHALSLPALPAGAYVLRLKHNGHTWTRQVIRNP